MNIFSLSLVFVISLLLWTPVSSQDQGSQCIVSPDIITHSQFPSRMYLSYEESTKLRMKNYFTGTNLTFTYSIADSPQIELNKLKAVGKDGNSFQDTIDQILNGTGSVVDIYWEDSNVTDISQQWASDSIVAVLLESASNSTNNFTLVIGPINQLHAPQNESEPLSHNRIKLDTPEGVESFNCSQVISIGKFEYYVDCMAIENDRFQHYLYYVELAAVPPSQFNTTLVSVPHKLPTRNFVGGRRMTSATVSQTSYLIVYNQLDGQKATCAMEIFSIKDASKPVLKAAYDSTSPVFASVVNINNIQVSSSFMYVTSQIDTFTIFKNWHQDQMTMTQQYHFDQMKFKDSNLRVIPGANGGQKESVVIVGSVNNAKLYALVFASQTYQGFYSIPLPPMQQSKLIFQIYSLSLGEDFFALSYAVAQVAETASTPCYYFAIIDITSTQVEDCHTLFASTDTDYVRFVKMNPAAKTDTLFLIRANSQYTNLAIYSPILSLTSVSKTTRVTLTISASGSPNKTFPLDLVVLKPNDTSINIDQDSKKVRKSLTQKGSQVILFLNESIYGPLMDFEVSKSQLTHTQKQILDQNLFIARKIQASLQHEEGATVVSCRRKNVNPLQELVLIENLGNDKFAFNFADVEFSSSIWSIQGLNANASARYTKDFKLTKSFYANGYDILLIANSKRHYLIFAKLNSLKTWSSDNFVNRTFSTQKQADIALKNLENMQIVERPNGNWSILVIVESKICINAFNREVNLTKRFEITPDQVSKAFTFIPGKLYTHGAYPDIVFATTSTGNATYIINYSNTFLNTTDIVDVNASATANAIFPTHKSSSSDEVIIQPFENDLFYIFPKLNIIEHWDLSVKKSAFFRRNLELYNFDINIAISKNVRKGNAFSSTTETLYLLATEKNTDALCILILKPNIASSYLVHAIKLGVIEDEKTEIFIDVSETKSTLYGPLYGDILMVSIGSSTQFWEVHPTPFIAFPVQSEDAEQSLTSVNLLYNLPLDISNPNETSSTSLSLSIYENEKRLQVKSKEALINEVNKNTTTLTLSLSDLFIGTVYSMNATNSAIALNFTSFIQLHANDSFPVNELPKSTTMNSVLIMQSYTYYLFPQTLYLFDNSGKKKIPYIPLGDSVCNRLYIDSTEKYGVAIYNLAEQTGFLPFCIDEIVQGNFKLKTLTNSPALQDVFIDGENSLMFLLIQARDQGNSSIRVYKLRCPNLQVDNPVSIIQGWSFSNSNLNLQKFDVFALSFEKTTNHILFILDANYGLRVISYVQKNQIVKLLDSIPFTDLYKNFPVDPSRIQFLDVSLIENKCTQQPCTAKVLLMAKNYHTLLLQFTVVNEDGGFRMGNCTTLLVSSDYQIEDYQYSKNSVVLLGRNLTLAKPSLDVMTFNISAGSFNFTNSFLNDKGKYPYKTPIWIYTLESDLNQYLKQNQIALSYPTVFLVNDKQNETLIFPNLRTMSTETYRISDTFGLVWNNETSLKKATLNFNISDKFGHQLVEYRLSIVSDEITKKLPYIIWTVGTIMTIAIILFSFHLYSKSRSKKIQYARKKQQDPLRDMLL